MSNTLPPFPPTEPHESVLTDPNELYFRQCPPSPAYIDDGVPTVQLFSESSGDNGQLSGARSSKVSAKESYEERIARGGLTAGTWAISVAEAHHAGTRAVDDSSASAEKPTGHTYLDYRHLASTNKNTRKAVRTRLHEFATSRGRQWPL